MATLKDKGDKKATTVGNYSLGAVLGKGGFGTVYSGLDIENGDFVAVKQINLQKIPKDQLNSIMQEIDLLKNLNHANIVKYIKYVKTKEYLCIVLEYVENGSLANIVKKFGKFPESLVCVYITQVLEGLVYLHEQGVVHRDIKGANILTTKEGVIKLADFGVATKFGDEKDATVVGTPYWMAPEIIELNGASTASDIWSVGCTVIELLTGDPPYFDLGPMPALFRIVQDDYPPLPEGVSPALKDWLMQCFQKDPMLRISAQKLLKHKWIQSAKRKQTTVEAEGADVTKNIQDYNAKLKSKAKALPPVIAPTAEHRKSPQRALLPPPEDESDDWGDDFTFSPNGLKNVAAQPSKSKQDTKQKNSKPVAKEEENEDDWGDDFTFSPKAPKPKLELGSNKKSNPPAKPVVKEEDNDDWGDDFAFGSKDDLAPLKGLLSKASLADDVFDGLDDGFDTKVKLNGKLASSVKPVVPDKTLGINQANDGIGKWGEDNDDYDDWNDVDDLDSRLKKQLKKDSTVRLKPVRAVSASDDSDDDIFGEFEEESDDDFDLDTNLVKDNLTKMSEQILKLMAKLQPDQEEEVILSTTQELIAIFKENPAQKSHLIRHNGVIPIMEMLEVSNARVLHSLLQVVNQIIENNTEIQENLCLVGGIPAIMKFAGREYSLAIRLECANFVSKMCSTSTLTLQMVIACRGLPVLVDILSTPYEESKVLVWMAMDAICSVFELQSTTPKNDFCRLFSKCGLLRVMAAVLKLAAEDVEANSKKYPEKIANIFLFFSSADSVVKMSMSQIEVLSILFDTMDRLRPEVLVKILKSIKQLSMDHNTLVNVQRAGAIRRLVKILGVRQGLFVTEMHNQVLGTMYNLCRLDPDRQYQAAVEGIVPHLQYIIASQSPLKQFALPLICDLAHVKKARPELWQFRGVEFYLDLLEEEYWQVNALDSLSVWLADETKRVEEIMVQPHQISKIVSAFESAKHAAFVNLMEPILRTLAASPTINRALATSSFVPKLLERLQHPNPQVRVNLLKTLTSLYEYHPNPKKMIAEYQLFPVVKRLAEDKTVLVRNLASKLLVAFNANTVV